MTKTYNSKISYTLLIIVFLVFFAPTVYNLWRGDASSISLYLMLIKSGVFIFILHTFFSTTYTIKEGSLKIKCGILMNREIKIESIKTINQTNTIMSAPAASFDRLSIRYNKLDEIVISPRDQEKFCQDLKLINPKIAVTL